MALTDDKVTIDINRLSIADIDDFKELTGKDLETYLDEVQERPEGDRTLTETFSPEFRAMLWIVLRDDETRERFYNDTDELSRAMQQDIRRIGLSDFDRFEISSGVPKESSAPSPEARLVTQSAGRATTMPDGSPAPQDLPPASNPAPYRRQ